MIFPVKIDPIMTHHRYICMILSAANKSVQEDDALSVRKLFSKDSAQCVSVAAFAVKSPRAVELQANWVEIISKVHPRNDPFTPIKC